MSSYTQMLCPSCPTLASVLIWASSTVIYLGRSSSAVMPISLFSSSVFRWSSLLQYLIDAVHCSLALAQLSQGRGTWDPCLSGELHAAATVIEPQGTNLMPHQHSLALCSSQQHDARVSAILQRPAVVRNSPCLQRGYLAAVLGLSFRCKAARGRCVGRGSGVPAGVPFRLWGLPGTLGAACGCPQGPVTQATPSCLGC